MTTTETLSPTQVIHHRDVGCGGEPRMARLCDAALSGDRRAMALVAEDVNRMDVEWGVTYETDEDALPAMGARIRAMSVVMGVPIVDLKMSHVVDADLEGIPTVASHRVAEKWARVVSCIGMAAAQEALLVPSGTHIVGRIHDEIILEPGVAEGCEDACCNDLDGYED